MSRSSLALFLGLCATGLGLAGCAQPADEALNLNPLGIGPAPAAATVTNLVGATPASLTASFGAPMIRRVDGPAEVWLYHSPVCGLNLILYRDTAGTPRVADAVPDNGNAAACVSSLQQRGTTVAMEHVSGS
jgi:hypothetical protein